MHAVNSVTVGKRTIDFYTFSGNVLDPQAWSTTETYGGGTSGFIHQGTGLVTSSSVRSITTEHTQFFLRSSDGQELAVKLENFRVALRPGNRVTVVWAADRGKEAVTTDCNFVAVHNHDTKVLMTDKQKLKEIAIPRYGRFLFGVSVLLAIGAVFVFGSFGFVSGGVNEPSSFAVYLLIGFVLWALAGWRLRGWGRPRFKKVADAFNVVAAKVLAA